MLVNLGSLITEPTETTVFSLSEYDNSSTFCTSQLTERCSSVVMEVDLKHLCQLVEMKNGGPSWIHMMDRSTLSMSYQAAERSKGPQYCRKTIFEDVTTKMVRDLFRDDFDQSGMTCPHILQPLKSVLQQRLW